MTTRQPTPNILAEQPAADDAMTLAMGDQVERIATVRIRLDGGTQPRAGIDHTVVDDYYTDMASGAQFPPVELVYDGTDYWLWDGFHRFHAFRRDGDRAIPAHVRQGTRRDAVLLSVGANATHGFRRTNADKRRAVVVLLRDDEWRHMSNPEIARRCAVDEKTVRYIRTELEATSEIPKSNERTGADGRTIDTTNIGKRPTEPAQAGQEPDILVSIDLEIAIGDWLEAFDDQTATLAELVRDGRSSILFEDLAANITAPCRPADILAAVRTFAQRMEYTRKVLADSLPPHVARNGGNNEWYTPAEIIDSAMAVLGFIHLDPASTEIANTVVNAQTFYTVDDDSLNRPWIGKVWMNPPYAQPLINQFVNKLIAEYEAKRVQEAIVLVNNATETIWFQNLAEASNAICFPVGRVRFWAPDRTAAPLQGQAILYLGSKTIFFLNEFRKLGCVAEIKHYD